MPTQGEVSASSPRVNAALTPAALEIAAVMRRYALDYSQALTVAREARRLVGIVPKRKRNSSPPQLTGEQLQAFLEAVQRVGNPQHIVLFTLIARTPLRIGEILNLPIEAVTSHERCIKLGNTSNQPEQAIKLPAGLVVAIQNYLEHIVGQTYLFESRRKAKLSMRWVQMLARSYGEQAGIKEMKCNLLRYRTSRQK